MAEPHSGNKTASPACTAGTHRLQPVHPVGEGAPVGGGHPGRWLASACAAWWAASAHARATVEEVNGGAGR